MLQNAGLRSSYVAISVATAYAEIAEEAGLTLPFRVWLRNCDPSSVAVLISSRNIGTAVVPMTGYAALEVAAALLVERVSVALILPTQIPRSACDVVELARWASRCRPEGRQAAPSLLPALRDQIRKPTNFENSTALLGMTASALGVAMWPRSIFLDLSPMAPDSSLNSAAEFLSPCTGST